MIFDVLTLFPDIIEDYCEYSIMKRAKDAGVFELHTVNPRDFTLDKHKRSMILHTAAERGWFLRLSLMSMRMKA